jgi:hypothetical protein
MVLHFKKPIAVKEIEVAQLGLLAFSKRIKEEKNEKNAFSNDNHRTGFAVFG